MIKQVYTLERFKVCLSGPVWSGLVRSGPVWSVPIEFLRKSISVNPRNYTYAFPRRLPMSSHVGELV